MTTDLQITSIAKETIEILKYFEPDFVSKIPDNFMDELRSLAQTSNITVKIDKNKKLKEQNISKESKDMISLIYYSYIATEKEKIEIEKIWNENEKQYENNVQEQYNPENLFKKKNKNETENNHMILYKEETYINKILSKIKSFIKSMIRKGEK